MTLEEVCEAFELWRTNRIKRTPIPETLWSMVQELLPYYKKSLIAETLRINTTQLELGCQKSRFAENKAGSGFAKGYFNHQPPLHALPPKTSQACTLALNGSRNNLQIHIDIQQLAHVLPLLERYL